MKLRNKKTGEVADLSEGLIKDTYSGEFIQVKPVAVSNKEGYLYSSLAELNEEWEDYQPAEPLIKDEKIRKAVRAWAEANNVLEVFAGRVGDGTYMTLLELYDEDDERRRISVPSAFSPEGMKAGEAYTIAELCGEEEE